MKQIKKEKTGAARTRDLVCGMDLSELADLAEVPYKGASFYFCGSGCAERFKSDPERFQKEPLIRLSNVWKVFKMGAVETQALRGVDLNVWEGDFISIIGASGSGKSTVLNMIGLLDRPTDGSVFYKGKDVSLFNDEERTELRSRIFGFVFQQYNLIPWLTAFENVSLPLIFSRRNSARNIEALFTEVDIKERMTHRPFELSGGEQQRVAILRALVNDPEVILGDEPTGNLDSATGGKILDMLVQLNKNRKKTLIVVTHDPHIAGKADQTIAIKDGRVVRNHLAYKKLYVDEHGHG